MTSYILYLKLKQEIYSQNSATARVTHYADKAWTGLPHAHTPMFRWGSNGPLDPF